MPVHNNPAPNAKNQANERPSPVLPDTFEWDELNHDCIGPAQPSPAQPTSPPRPCVIAGLRPWRNGKYKLGVSQLGDHTVFHNYGHGGAGITMSWGCANEIVKLVSAHTPSTDNPEIAILGAGVMGLTSAILLAESGYANIKIYAGKMTPHTTSDIAGGQWSPSAVRIGSTPQDEAEFERIMRFSHARFSDLLNKDYGVHERDNFVHRKGDLGSSFKRVPAGLLQMTKLAKLPFDSSFDHHPDGGWKVVTLLIEPPIFMPKLMSDLSVKHSIHPQTRSFSTSAEIEELDEKLIINCTGFGAKKLFGDPELFPLRGQLILLPPQNNVDYLFSAGQSYVFSRTDGLILGGTFYQSNNTAALESDGRKIWKGNTDIFSADKATSRRALEGLEAMSDVEAPDSLSYEIGGESYNDT